MTDFADTGGSTGTALLDDTDTSLDTPVSVVVWDDPVNLMTYVVMVFKSVFPDWPLDKCKRKMLEVHEQGRSTVFSGERSEAELIASKIQAFQLWATVER